MRTYISSIDKKPTREMDLRLTNNETKGVMYDETIILLGHSGSVLSAKFSPSGENIASGGMDRDILLWKLPTDPEDELPNYGVLQGHKGAVTALSWSLDSTLFSASSDTTVAFWDTETGIKRRVGKGHTAIVNDCATLGFIGLSVGDDGAAMIWDEREKNEIHKFSTEYPLLACAASKDTIYLSGIDSCIRAYDLSTNKLAWKSQPFQDPVTSLALSHDGSMLAARSMEGDVRLLSTNKILTDGVSRVGRYGYEGSAGGPQKNLVKVAFSGDDTLLALGSEEPVCVVWASASRRMMHRLTHQTKAILDVDFHPTEKIILTASADLSLVLRQL